MYKKGCFLYLKKNAMGKTVFSRLNYYNEIEIKMDEESLFQERLVYEDLFHFFTKLFSI